MMIHSPVARREIPTGLTGMGFTAACNWVDEFGECVQPGTTGTVLTQAEYAARTAAAGSGTGSGSGSGSFTSWISGAVSNNKTLILMTAAVVGLLIATKGGGGNR